MKNDLPLRSTSPATLLMNPVWIQVRSCEAAAGAVWIRPGSCSSAGPGRGGAAAGNPSRITEEWTIE